MNLSEHAGLRALMEIAPPTTREREVFEPWPIVEQQLGTPLPADYKALLEVYGGAGLFGDEIVVHSPFSKNQLFNSQSVAAWKIPGLRELRDSTPQDFPWPLWPERFGWIPWGSGGNGETYWWVTTGEPDFWGTAISEARGPSMEYFGNSMSWLLYKLCTGEIEPLLVNGNVRSSKGFKPLE